jgi:hypothetical protein
MQHVLSLPISRRNHNIIEIHIGRRPRIREHHLMFSIRQIRPRIKQRLKRRRVALSILGRDLAVDRDKEGTVVLSLGTV